MAYPVASRELDPSSILLSELKSELSPGSLVLAPVFRQCLDSRLTEPELGYHAELCWEYTCVLFYDAKLKVTYYTAVDD